MSDQAQSNSSQMKTLFSALVILVSFGFVVLILTGNFGRESIEDRAYMGDFSAETIETRWANLEEVTSAQEALVDESKVEAALSELAGNVPAAAKTDIVVPGSPTFMKQAEEAAAAAEATEEVTPEEGAEVKPETAPAKKEAKPAESKESAKKADTPKAGKEGAKGKGKAKGKAKV